jgi:hypothetical protein
VQYFVISDWNWSLPQQVLHLLFGLLPLASVHLCAQRHFKVFDSSAASSLYQLYQLPSAIDAVSEQPSLFGGKGLDFRDFERMMSR